MGEGGPRTARNGVYKGNKDWPATKRQRGFEEGSDWMVEEKWSRFRGGSGEGRFLQEDHQRIKKGGKSRSSGGENSAAVDVDKNLVHQDAPQRRSNRSLGGPALSLLVGRR